MFKQTPQAAGTAAITPFLDHLALEERVAPATQKQAFNAIVFLTRKAFGIEDFTIEKPAAAIGGNRRPPVVLTRDEVRVVIARLDGVWKLAALIMYGSGLRLMECLSLRVKDLDFGHGTITIHDGKGGKHRVVPLPRALEPTLRKYLDSARQKHLQDLAVGAGEVHLPESLARKYPNACREWAGSFRCSGSTCLPSPRRLPSARWPQSRHACSSKGTESRLHVCRGRYADMQTRPDIRRCSNG